MYVWVLMSCVQYPPEFFSFRRTAEPLTGASPSDWNPAAGHRKRLQLLRMIYGGGPSSCSIFLLLLTETLIVTSNMASHSDLIWGSLSETVVRLNVLNLFLSFFLSFYRSPFSYSSV